MQAMALARRAPTAPAALCSCRSSPALRSTPASAAWRPRAEPRRRSAAPRAGLDIDWSDPDTLVAVAGGVLGLAVGIGAPLFYISRDERDEQRLQELRQLNRETFKETGEYLSEDEIRAIRQPRWTDRREFQDDD